MAVIVAKRAVAILCTMLAVVVVTCGLVALIAASVVTSFKAVAHSRVVSCTPCRCTIGSAVIP